MQEIFPSSFGGRGLSLLVAEVLNILFEAITTMRDVDVPLVFGDHLNADTIVVLTNHNWASVRAAAVRLLAVYFTRYLHNAPYQHLL